MGPLLAPFRCRLAGLAWPSGLTGRAAWARRTALAAFAGLTAGTGCSPVTAVTPVTTGTAFTTGTTFATGTTLTALAAVTALAGRAVGARLAVGTGLAGGTVGAGCTVGSRHAGGADFSAGTTVVAVAAGVTGSDGIKAGAAVGVVTPRRSVARKRVDHRADDSRAAGWVDRDGVRSGHGGDQRQGQECAGYGAQADHLPVVTRVGVKRRAAPPGEVLRNHRFAFLSAW